MDTGVKGESGTATTNWGGTIPYIDPHVHMADLGWDALESMGIGGMAAAVNPMARPDVVIKKRSGAFDADDILRCWDHMLWLAERFEKTFFYKVYVALSWGSNSRVHDVDRLHRALADYLKHGRVVAVGELGLDPYQWSTTVSQEDSEAIIAEQLSVAKDLNVPVVLHSPMLKSSAHYIEGPKLPDGAPAWPFKVSTAKRTFAIAERVGLDHTQVVIDHSDNDLIQWALENTNAYVAISGACVWRGIAPWQAAQWVQKYGPERIMVNSDAHQHLSMDALWLPRTIREMRRVGLEEPIIRRVVYENPKKFYRLSI
ncbi:MAG: TatD family hydrolase [Betaproteobacteria bacterium]|nr:TatD family hydrolase [Betaproteobacteria bacterium]